MNSSILTNIIEHVSKLCSAYFAEEITYQNLRKHTRHRSLAWTRYLICKIVAEVSAINYSQMGELLNIDRTTIYVGVQKINDIIDTEKGFAQLYNQCLQFAQELIINYPKGFNINEIKTLGQFRNITSSLPDDAPFVLMMSGKKTEILLQKINDSLILSTP